VDAMNGLGRKGAISESFLADRLEGSVEPRSEPFTRVFAKARQDGGIGLADKTDARSSGRRE
jgi:hypothetical protein